MTRIDRSGFTVIGIGDRTTNKQEAGPGAIIPRHWQRFFGENLVAKIPNQAGPTVYALYTDYADRRDGEYGHIVGVKVKEATMVPAGMVAKQVPAGRYVVITSDKGPVSKVVPDAWRRVWQLEDEGKLERAYQTDFELYDERGRDPANAQVDLYIGVK
jgi:predicted transcriptional regulator YdeE